MHTERAHRDLIATAHQSLQFSQGSAGDEHLLVRGQYLLANEIAHRKPIRVGGDHPQSVALSRHHHTRKNRTSLVGTGCTHHLAECIAKGSGRQGYRGVDR